MSRHRIDGRDPTHTVDVGFLDDRYFAYVTDANSESIATIDVGNVFDLRSQLAPYATIPPDVIREIYGGRSASDRPDHIVDHRTERQPERQASSGPAEFVEQIAVSTWLDPIGTKSLIDDMTDDPAAQRPGLRAIVSVAREAYDRTIAEMRNAPNHLALEEDVRESLIARLTSVDWYAPVSGAISTMDPSARADLSARITDVLGAVAQEATEDYTAARRSIQFFSNNGGLTPSTPTEAKYEFFITTTIRAAYDVGLADAVGPDLSRSVDIGAVRDGLDDVVAAWRSVGDTDQSRILQDRVEGDLREAARLNPRETRRMFDDFIASNSNHLDPLAPAAELQGLSSLRRAIDVGETEGRNDLELAPRMQWIKDKIPRALEIAHNQEVDPSALSPADVDRGALEARMVTSVEALTQLRDLEPDELARRTRMLTALEKGGVTAFEQRSNESIEDAIDRAAMRFMQDRHPVDLSSLPEFISRPTDVITDRTTKGPEIKVVDQSLTIVGRLGTDKVVGRDGSAFAVVSASAFTATPKVGDEVHLTRDSSGHDRAGNADHEITLER
jgi:hypothetical protein